MTRAAFARVTGLGEATLNRWENGIMIQTPREMIAICGFWRAPRPCKDSGVFGLH